MSKLLIPLPISGCEASLVLSYIQLEDGYMAVFGGRDDGTERTCFDGSLLLDRGGPSGVPSETTQS